MVGISCFIIQRDVMRIKWIKAHRELRTGTERILYICIYLSIYLFIILLVTCWASPWFSNKESACQCRRHGFDSWISKIPWRRKWQPTPVFLPGKSHVLTSLVGYSSVGSQKSQTRLSDWTTPPLLLLQKQGCSADIQVILTHHFCLPCSICPLFRSTVMDYTDQCNSSISAYDLWICLFLY